MKILIIAATKTELLPLYAYFGLVDENFVSSKNFDVLISGVGMMATAYALGEKLCLKNYDFIINLGIAGCFDTTQPLGKLFNITKDSFADLGAQDKNTFISLEEMKLGESVYFSSNPFEITLPSATSITVNTVSGNEETILARTQQWAPLLESMEGAAVFYAAKSHNLSVIQVRSVSNYVTPRDPSTWKIRLAIEKLNEWAIAFLEEQSSPR